MIHLHPTSTAGCKTEAAKETPHCRSSKHAYNCNPLTSIRNYWMIALLAFSSKAKQAHLRTKIIEIHLSLNVRHPYHRSHMFMHGCVLSILHILFHSFIYGNQTSLWQATAVVDTPTFIIDSSIIRFELSGIKFPVLYSFVERGEKRGDVLAHAYDQLKPDWWVLIKRSHTTQLFFDSNSYFYCTRCVYYVACSYNKCTLQAAME